MKTKMLTTTLALFFCAIGSASAATQTSHRSFRGENLFGTFTTTQAFLCADGSVLTAEASIFVTAFTQIARFNGSSDVDDELQVAVFGINPCLNESYLAAATVQNSNYSQSSVNRAVLRQTVTLEQIYGEGGAGVLAMDLVFNGVAEVSVSKVNQREVYPGVMSIVVSRGASRQATVSGSITLNNEPATLVDAAYLNYSRSGVHTIVRTSPSSP